MAWRGEGEMESSFETGVTLVQKSVQKLGQKSGRNARAQTAGQGGGLGGGHPEMNRVVIESR